MSLIFLTSLTMIAFAANSILCRLALIHPENDPVSFTVVRLVSGTLILLPVFLKYYRKEKIEFNLSFVMMPLMLFSYALFFALAYVQLHSGIGALIVFTSVQLTMMIAAIFQEKKLSRNEKLGYLLAASGFVYLLLPGIEMPPLGPSMLMMIAGVSWGFYSILGKKVSDPIFGTAQNFLLTTPILLVLFFHPIQLTQEGYLLAIVSGAITSGLGYLLWYIVLKKLQTSTAAIVLFSAPILVAIGGVLFIGESISARLVISSALVFIGIVLKVKT